MYKKRHFNKRWIKKHLNNKWLNIEITAKCTLLCPQCKRITFLSLNDGNFPGKDLTPQQFRKIIKHFNKITFCGQLSDPIFGEHFIELLKICHHHEIATRVLTAATGKKELFYREAFAANPNAQWTFGIDGPPYLSSRYRVNQNGEFIFEIMKLAKQMTQKGTFWQYIIFPWNEQYIEECKQKAKEIGLEILFIQSERTGKSIEKKMNTAQKRQKKMAIQEYLFNQGNIIKTDRDTELVPRCIFSDQDMTLSSEGFFTPCCWLDDELYRNQPYVNDFFQPYLKIENNENIEKIFNSKVWMRFWKILLNNPEKAPPVCWEYCANRKGKIDTIEVGHNYKIIKKH